MLLHLSFSTLFRLAGVAVSMCAAMTIDTYTVYGMSSQAVSLLALQFRAPFSANLPSPIVAPQDVDGMCDGLQVKGVDAQTDTAEMVQLQAIWYRTSIQFKGYTVRKPQPPAKTKTAIAILNCSPEPQPAPSIRFRRNQRFKALRQGYFATSHRLIISCRQELRKCI